MANGRRRKGRRPGLASIRRLGTRADAGNRLGPILLPHHCVQAAQFDAERESSVAAVAGASGPVTIWLRTPKLKNQLSDRKTAHARTAILSLLGTEANSELLKES